MSMALHELATNAAKYGALSNGAGVLSVTWRVLGAETLELTWVESAGPPVAPPEAEGFGSRLVRQMARQLGGEIVFRWQPEGLTVVLTADLRPPSETDLASAWQSAET